MSHVYWVTFRIEQTGNASARYKALIDTLDELTQHLSWSAPGAFVLFRSPRSIGEIAERIRNSIDPEVDLALVGMSEFRSARVVGAVPDEALLELMPFARQA
ncbi:MAG: hypothetical protein ACXWU1_10755 [Allosphingosinicella sp.]